MSVTPPPPLDPNDPRAGDPTSPVTWVRVGGLIILVIVVGTIYRWNSGGGSGAAPSSQTTAAVQTVPTGASPAGTYKIVFTGSATSQYSKPDYSQAFKSNQGTATWSLEYTYGQGSTGTPDAATAKVTGSGETKMWRSNGACKTSSVKYTPNVSILKSSGGDTFRLTAPIAGDLISAPGSGCDPLTTDGLDPFGRVYTVTCEIELCPDLEAYWSAEFTIKAGQTGTVTTNIPTKKLDFINSAPRGGEHSVDSWSGTITVIAQ